MLLQIVAAIASLILCAYYFVLSLPPFKFLDFFLYGVKAPLPPKESPKRNELPKTPSLRRTSSTSTMPLNFAFVRAKGIRLHYAYMGKTGTEVPLLLFLHGFPECWYSWRHALSYFAKDYKVVALDMRGYSYSEKPQSRTDYAIEPLVEDIQAVIKAMDHERCILISHDWGGVVAWYFASKYPDLIEKLVVCNAPHPLAMREALLKSATQVKMSWYIFFFQLPFLPEWYISRNGFSTLKNILKTQLRNKENCSEGLKNETVIAASQPGAITAMINYYRNLFSFTRLVEKLEPIRVPTLLLWGKLDVHLEADLCERAKKYVSDLTVAQCDASHWLQNDEPTFVTSEIEKFLKPNTK